MAVDWNFYGSMRFQTEWQDFDLGDGVNVIGDDDDDGLLWTGSGSRMGAKVKADHLSGMFEVGLNGGSSGDAEVTTRRWEGAWDFGPATFKLAKGYAGVYQFLSGASQFSDGNLLGNGFLYGGRPEFVGLEFGGFGIYLIDPEVGSGLNPTGLAALPANDTDVTIPKIEARFGMSFDSLAFTLMGGYQTYEVDLGGGDDWDVDSWIVGGDVTFNFGPARISGALSYAENGGDAGYAGMYGAQFDGDDDVKDGTSWMAGISASWRFTDMVELEGGFGYRNDETDANVDEDDNDVYAYYIQANLTLAPGVNFLPGYTYIDNGDEIGDGDSDGSDWSIGGKWQIDF
jgi:hypothetical protein